MIGLDVKCSATAASGPSASLFAAAAAVLTVEVLGVSLASAAGTASGRARLVAITGEPMLVAAAQPHYGQPLEFAGVQVAPPALVLTRQTAAALWELRVPLAAPLSIGGALAIEARATLQDGTVVDFRGQALVAWDTPDPAPAPTPAPGPPSPPSPLPEPDLSKADWHKCNAARSKRAAVLNSCSFDGSQFRFAYATAVNGWQANAQRLNAYTCFFVNRGGRWTGGKFDWLRRGQTAKDVKNIRAGYTDGIVPVKGEQVAFCLVSLDCFTRSNAILVTWR